MKDDPLRWSAFAKKSAEMLAEWMIEVLDEHPFLKTSEVAGDSEVLAELLQADLLAPPLAKTNCRNPRRLRCNRFVGGIGDGNLEHGLSPEIQCRRLLDWNV